MHFLKFKMILGFMLAGMMTPSLLASASSNGAHEIVAYFISGIEISGTQVRVTSPLLQKIFIKLGVTDISLSFPEFQRLGATTDQDDQGDLLKKTFFSRVVTLTLKESADVDNAVGTLSRLKEVLYAEKNEVDAEWFSDADYPLQWHLNNTGQAGGTPGADIMVEEAWKIFTGSPDVTIGIMDTGVDLSHEEFAGKISGDDYSENNCQLQHGTHVAGIAAALHDNNGKVRGVDGYASIISGKLAGDPPYCGWKSGSEVASKIIDAVDQGADVLNHSWGDKVFNQTVYEAFLYAYFKNSVSVVSMGNDYGQVVNYPAAYGQPVIAVGATTNQDTKSDFSTTGSHIDVSAPGGDGTSGGSEDVYSTYPDNSYAYLSGTSMAAPVVTGMASLLKGCQPGLYNDDIKQIIRLSADDLGSTTGWDYYYGTGRVNAWRALTYASALSHGSAGNGTQVSSSGGMWWSFIGSANGLAPGIYYVKRHEIQADITFPYAENPQVWVRGVGTQGWSAANPNNGMGWFETVPGTLTNTSATLRSYVYEVFYNSIGQKINQFFPASPFNASFAYTVFDKPEDDLWFQNGFLGEKHDFYASRAIYSGEKVDPNSQFGEFQVKAGADVLFEAGKEILLEPGFSAKEGSQFIAQIKTDYCL